jgi:RNA polymerase primary sigma factor
MVSSDERDRSLSALEQYKRTVRWIPLLQNEEEVRLLQCLALRENVQQARDRLVAGYQHLVLALARRFERHCRVMELLDLVQEGNQGLLWAIERYDSTRETSSFRTWAFERIRGMMLTALWQYEGAVRLPQRKVAAIKRIDEVMTELYDLLGREPTLEEVAGRMGRAQKEVRELLVLQELQKSQSLSESLDVDGEVFLADVIEDPAALAPADVGCSSLEEILQRLTERERAVLLARYGDGHTRTQAETAALLGISLAKVRKLDRRARIRLRKVLDRYSV